MHNEYIIDNFGCTRRERIVIITSGLRFYLKKQCVHKKFGIKIRMDKKVFFFVPRMKFMIEYMCLFSNKNDLAIYRMINRVSYRSLTFSFLRINNVIFNYILIKQNNS